MAALAEAVASGTEGCRSRDRDQLVSFPVPNQFLGTASDLVGVFGVR